MSLRTRFALGIHDYTDSRGQFLPVGHSMVLMAESLPLELGYRNSGTKGNPRKPVGFRANIGYRILTSMIEVKWSLGK